MLIIFKTKYNYSLPHDALGLALVFNLGILRRRGERVVANHYLAN